MTITGGGGEGSVLTAYVVQSFKSYLFSFLFELPPFRRKEQKCPHPPIKISAQIGVDMARFVGLVCNTVKAAFKSKDVVGTNIYHLLSFSSLPPPPPFHPTHIGHFAGRQMKSKHIIYINT